MKVKSIFFLLIFLLIFVDPYLVNVAIGPLHITLLRVFLVGYLAVMVHNIVMNGYRYRLSVEPVSNYLYFLLIWFAYGLMSVVWSADKILAIKEMYYFAIFLLLIIALIDLLKDRKTIELINYSFIFIGVVTVVVCLLELAFYIHLPTSRYVIEADTYSALGLRVATAFFYNENDLSLFLVMILPFFLIYIKSKVQLVRWFCVCLLILITLVLVTNGSRLALIAYFIQIICFLSIANKNIINRLKWMTILFVPTILLFIWDPLSRVLDLAGVQGQYGSSFVRLNLILSGLYSLYQSFMIGVGPGNFHLNMSPLFETRGITNPHNWWVEIITHYGLFIFIGYVLFTLILMKNLYKIYRRTYSYTSLALFISFIGFLIACMGPSRLFYFWPMWLLYGVSLAYINFTKQSLLNEKI